MRFSWIDIAIIVLGIIALTRIISNYTRVTNASPQEIQKKLEQGEPLQIVDVRSREEFEQWHIPGALSIPIDRLDEDPAAAAAELDPEKPIVVLCETGSRSALAYHILRDRAGFDQLINMRSGLVNWKGEITSG